MLDLKFIRENPELVREAARKKRNDLPLDELLALDERIRQNDKHIQDLQTALRSGSKDFRAATPEGKEDLRLRGQALKVEIDALKGSAKGDEDRLHDLLLRVPQIPDPSVPEGDGEDGNVPVAHWGTPPQFDFTPLDHVALMERHAMLDIERGARVAGNRSYILKNAGALLEFALLRFALDKVVAHGFTPLIVPALAREFALIGTGQFPAGREQIYSLPEDELFLVGTAEVSMTGMYAGEILPYADLPIKMVAQSPCFRREAGSFGQGCARRDARSPVHEGRAVRDLRRRSAALHGLAGDLAPQRRGDPAGPGAALQGAAGLHRRHGRWQGQDVRH